MIGRRLEQQGVGRDAVLVAVTAGPQHGVGRGCLGREAADHAVGPGAFGDQPLELRQVGTPEHFSRRPVGRAVPGEQDDAWFAVDVD